jgi:hypothetical protein
MEHQIRPDDIDLPPTQPIDISHWLTHGDSAER